MPGKVAAGPAVGTWLREAAEAIRGIDAGAVERAAAILVETRNGDGTIFVAGNGGSAATASHLALDLQKAARAPGGRGTRAISLSDSMGLVTAWGNDTDFERVFAEQLEVLGRPGDSLVIVSVSGSSPNLMTLVSAARSLGIRTVGLLGRTGGKVRDLVDVAVLVPCDDYGWVESAHVVLHHALTYAVREAARTEHG
ncbi:MAG TPA: SIS domain-containing protein [Gemmatimonadales bacterium]|nr:SIS domain-containing protein [Gemmatimonadales bacterium]